MVTFIVCVCVFHCIICTARRLLWYRLSETYTILRSTLSRHFSKATRYYHKNTHYCPPHVCYNKRSAVLFLPSRNLNLFVKGTSNLECFTPAHTQLWVISITPWCNLLTLTLSICQLSGTYTVGHSLVTLLLISL